MSPSQPRDIVLVDDSELDAYFFERWVKRSTVRNPVRTFLTGELFLAHMASVEAGESPMPALVLLDINMPGRSGFDVLDELRQRPAFDTDPAVVLYTNSDSPLDRRRAAELGVDFVEKFSSRADAVAFLSAWERLDA